MAGNTRDITLLGKGQRLTPLSDIVSSPDSAPSVYSGGRIVPLSENTSLHDKGSQNSGMQSIQLGAMPKMEVTPQQYRFIMNHLAGIKDKAQAEAEEIRLASALSYSRNFGLPLDYCLRNLEEMNKAYLGTEYKATATNFRAIYNEGQIGKLTVERGRLGNLIMNTSDPAKREELLAQVSEIDASIESMQDSLPRNWLVEMAKMTGNSLYFTASSGVAGLKGAGVGAIGVGVLQGLGTIGVSNPLTAVPVAGTIAAVSLLFQGKNTYEIESGNTYLDLLNNGVEPEIAKGMGNIGGLINAAIEAGLGGLTSSWLTKLGVPVDSFVSKLTTRMLANGHLGAFGKVLMDVGTSSIEEGLEEGFQGIATSLAEDIAYTISETSDVEPDWNVIESFASDFVGGAASSVLLGLPASAISANSDYRTVKGLDAVAMSVRSRESYDAIAASLKPDDSITDEDWKAFTDKRFDEAEKRGFEEFRAEVNQKTLDTTLTDLDEDVELDTDDGKLEGEEEQTAHPVDRMKGGRLYGHETGETQHLPRRFQAHTFSYGSPVSGDTYGAITYRTDRDGNLTITNLRTREGYQNLREEMVSDFISRYPDMNIEWETNTAEEADLKDRLINTNPRGVSYGLNYGELADSSDVQAIKSKLSDYFSYDETMNNAMATVVSLAAARRGMTGQELFDRYIEDIRRWTPEEQMEADRGLKPGQHRTGATEFYHLTDGVKAVIYAGENANPTTFMHEMTHLLRRIDGGDSEFRTLFDSLRNDESFKRFVDNNKMIHHKDLSTLFMTEEWTEADDEFFTELSEAYWTSGQAGSARLRGFFDRLKRTFRRIYDALRGTGHLNDEIVAYYDNFFGVGDKAASVSSTADTAGAERTVSQNTAQDASSDVLSGEELPDAETAGDVSAEEVNVQPSAPERGMLDDWKAMRFREAFRSITDNEAIITALENIPVALHKAAGLVRESAGSVTATDRYSLDPRYSNLTEEDAERMQKNAERYEAEAEKYEAKRRKVEDTTKRVTYTIDGRTYGEMARISSLGTFSPSQYIAQTGADSAFTLSIDADNVHIEGFRKPDPNMLWDGIEGERRYQTQEEVEALIQRAIETAESHIPVEYSESSWNALFGENRQIETPIGPVVMGHNQFKKLADRKRTDIVGMIKPTLERPSFIIREAHGSNNGNDSFNYIKVFNDKNGHRWLFSVVISQDDGWYVISNRGIHDNQLQKLLLKETNSLAYVAADNQRTPSFVQRRELTGRPIDNLSSQDAAVNKTAYQTQEESIEWKNTEDRLRADASNFDAEGRHLAPNGKPSNLSYEQWVTVRTPAFKRWFGDWEHAYRIKKWLSNENVLAIDSDKYSGLYELNWRSAKRYALDNLRGQYKVDDNGAVIELTRDGVSETISENMGSELGLRLITYIPDIIKNSIFVYAEENQKSKNTFDYYEYYLTDISVDSKNYVVKSAVGVRNGRRYYTFNLSEIKDKGAFIDSRPVSDIQPGRPTSQGSLPDIKDTRLLSILQADSSKVVDENGEPLVVYHGSKWAGGPIREFDINPAYGAMYLSSSKEVAESYIPESLNEANVDDLYPGTPELQPVFSLYANVRNPLFADAKGESWRSVEFEGEWLSSDDLIDIAMERGNDAVILRNVIDSSTVKTPATDLMIFDPNQLKSVDNQGTFSSESNDIYYQTAEESAEWRDTDIRLRDNEANFDIAGRHLAPNGKLSNLSYRDWVTVRTPSFIRWFGDWMNNPEEASKIVDENGEPMAMYHGSLESFSEFSRDFAGRTADTAGVGFWFSDREDFARSFASAEWQGEGTPQVYSVFLNIRNPRVYSSTPGLTYAQYKALTSEVERLSRLISRYEASTDRAISERELNQLREERDRIISSLEGSTDLDAYESFKSDMLIASGMSAKDVKDSGFSFDGEDNASAINERYISAMRSQGYDGIIIRDTKFDSDLIGESFNTQYVAFDPNQIKSVNNRGTFSSESNDILYQLSPEYVRENMDYETKMPTDDAFLDAVRNTPGARIEDDGIIIDLERWQKPEQDNEASVRTGVFYLPTGSSATRYYKGFTSTGLYGGSVKFRGETLLKAPLAVRGYTGGDVPLKAYEILKGEQAASELKHDADYLINSFKRDVRYDRLRELAEKYGINDDEYIDISDIFYNSEQGSQLKFAFQENVVAHALRDAGYDSVVGFNRRKLTEIFDVREGNYPSETSDTPWATYTPEAQTLYQTQAEEFSERLNGLMESVNPIIADQELHDVFEGDRISLKKLRAATKDIRGSYINRETGRTINFGRTALGELTRHDFRNREQAESIFHVPEFIENGRYTGAVNDPEGRIFDYYVSRFVYDGNDYLVWSSVITDRGDTYYDHKLISWKEIKDYLASGFEITSLGLDGSSPSTLKNTRLLSFLQGKEPVPATISRKTGKISGNTLFQTMTEEEQDAFVDAALDYALTNPERLYQIMDSDISDAVRDYMAELMSTAAEYTDYDEYYDAATWVIPQDEELMGAEQEELDKYILDAWNRKKNPEAAGTDADAPAPTLMNPDMSASTEEMKDEEFIQIISTDEGFDEWLNTIRRAVESNSDEGERAVANAVDQDGLVAPLLVNLIHPSHSAAVWGSFKGSKYRRIETDSAKAVASAKGILKANPSYYRDLYAKATGTDFWSSIYNDAVPAELQEISADDLRTLSVSERKRLAEDIRDENMKKAILSGTDPYKSEVLESLISKQERKIEDARADIRRLEAEKKAISRRASELLGDKQQLWRETTKLQDEIDKARTRLQEISERIAKASQRDFGEDGKVSQRLIDEQASIARQVTELVRQQDSYLRQLKNAEAEQRVYDARTEERWKASNRERQLKDRHKEEMADRYRRDLDRMSEIRAERDRKLQELKAYYRERDNLRKVREHKQKLANIIKKEPSKGVNWEQAEKIRAIQAFLDPNFRTSMMIDGKPYDINLLKAMFRGDVERDPVIFDSLSDAQLDRLSKKSLDEMTISELEDMATAVSQLREEGIKERKLIDSAQRKHVAKTRKMVLAAVMANPKFTDEPMPGSGEERKRERNWWRRFLDIYYGSANMSRRTQDMEGGKKGIIWNLLVGMKREAQDAENRMILKRMQPIQDFIKASHIDTSDFYEEFSIDLGEGRTASYRYTDLVYMYLSQNSRRNREAVAYGKLVTQLEKDAIREEVLNEIPGEGYNEKRTEESNRRIRELGDRRYENVIRQAEGIIRDPSRDVLFALVRLIEKDFNSDLFERLREAQQRIYNTVVTKEDYYLPINRTDYAGSSPAESVKQDLLNMIPGNGSVQRGFLDDRNDFSPYRQSNINTDFFRVWQNSVYAQEHALANMEYVRLLKGVFINNGSQAVRSAITNTFGSATMESIKNHISLIANPRSFQKMNKDADRIFRFLKGSLYSSYLGLRPRSIITQLITSWAPMWGAVNPIELARGYLAFSSHPNEVWAEICRLSPFMATRSMNPTLEWIKEEASKAELPKWRRGMAKLNEKGMMGLEWADRFSVGAGWWAIFQRERSRLLTEGNLRTDEEIDQAAAKIADDFVQETQPVSDITELSPLFQNRNEALKILTQFQASLNVVWQNVTRDIPNAFRNKQYAKAIGMSMGYVVSGIILYAVQDGLFGDDDDDDDRRGLGWRLLYSGVFSQPISGVPLISNYIDAAAEKIITGESEGVYNSPIFPPVDRVFRTINSMTNKDWEKAAENAINSMLLFTGLPYSALNDVKKAISWDDNGNVEYHPEVFIGRDPD